MGCTLDSGASGLGLNPGRDIVLCSWARHLTLTVVPISTQEYERVPANFWGNLTNCGAIGRSEIQQETGASFKF